MDLKKVEPMEKKKILVVDDSRSIREAICQILGSDYQIETAADGDTAIASAKTFRPDLVLLDINMPGPDGYAVCQELRSEPPSDFIKILMVSNRTKLDERLKGYQSGADDFIGKPFVPEELLAKVRVFMRLKTAEDELQRLNEALNEQVAIRTRQLLDAEKMAAVGRYAAGIVHNLSNPLQAIMGIAQLLAIRNPDDKNIMRLRKAAAQMKKIIGTILNTCQRESVEALVPIDLNEVIRDQIELLMADPFYKHQVQTITELNPLPTYKGIYLHFSQSLGNLIKNASDSMYESQSRVLTIKSSIEGEEIVILITDSGCGISEERLDRIFNPFYTTKPLAAEDARPTGTGLGLASGREMIESYGGSILVESSPGKGSCFMVRLPVKTETAP